MHPLVRAAAFVALLTALGSLDRGPLPQAPAIVTPAQAKGTDGMPALCPPGTLPEGPVCLRIPAADPARVEATQTARPSPIEEVIARRPERPSAWERYRFPIGSASPSGSANVTVDTRPDVSQVSQSSYGIRLVVPGDAPVLAAQLEHQVGSAEVLFAGEREGALTVATRHEVSAAGQTSYFWVVLRGLSRIEPGVQAGAKIAAGVPLGRGTIVGGQGAVFLETRQVRRGTALGEVRFWDPAVGVPIDARNVLVDKGANGP